MTNPNPLAASAPALQPPTPTQVMIAPDGSHGDIPVERVPDAVKAGYKIGFDMTAPDGTPGTVPIDQAHNATAKGFKPVGAPVVQQSALGSAEDFVKEFGKKINPINAVEGAAQLTSHPINTLTSDADARSQVYNEAEDAFKKGNHAEGAAKLLYSFLPLVGPQLNQAANNILSGHVAKGLGQSAGLGVALAGPAAIGESGIVGDAYDAAKQAAQDAHAKLTDALTQPDKPVPSAPTPKPVSPHVEIDTPFDDARIRKSVGKDLSLAARQTLKDAAGDTIQAGSSPENHLLKAVAPINNTITQQGLQLNQILQNAGPLKSSPLDAANTAIETLKNNLPGGTEEQFGKAIDKEFNRSLDELDTNDPVKVNQLKRDLDSRINSFRSPEEPINTAGDAQDAARVVLRRVLSNQLSKEIPATKPINDILSKNLEVRAALDKKLGDVSRDPVQADAQHQAELQKGQTILQNQASDAAAQQQYQTKAAQVAKNISRLKTAGWLAGGAGVTALLGKLKELADAF